MADGPISRIEWVEEQLRRAILNGDLKPGERLLTAQLSERFSVSPTPLREALHRFAGEGLVEFVPQRGARVTALSLEDSAELTQLRLLLEPVAVADAIAHATEEWHTSVSAASTELLKRWAATPHDARDSGNAYRELYAELTSTCTSSRLRHYTTVIRDQDARYRMATIDILDRDKLAREHRRLIKAALAGDEAAAADATRNEITHLAGAYRKVATGR
jgi:GntR family transcriptional regulator, carbon starvation induced regulator